MRNYLLIYHHLGLGDHIMCNAIVREKAKRYDLVCVIAKHHNVPSVNFMFRDLENFTIRGVCDDEEAMHFAKSVWKHEVLLLGGFAHGFDGSEFDVSFYRQAGVEFSDRWAKWTCPRDEAKEEKVFSEIGYLRRSDQKYFVFMHEDASRGLTIDARRSEHLTQWPYPGTSTIAPNPHLTPILFHWRKVIEACDEIHCIASSFAAFIDSIDLPKNPKLFLHSYCRPEEALMKISKDWQVLK